jgi:pyruvate,water dikinase
VCEACPTLTEEQRLVVHRPAATKREVPVVSSKYIVWFDDYDDGHHRARVGGKNASLGEMIHAGLPVPPGYAVTTDAFETLRAHQDVRAEVMKLRGEVDYADAAGMGEISHQIRAVMESVPIDDAVEEAIRRAYVQLCEVCELDDVPVAVRSSATAEDLPDASFAGEHDTFLWVKGTDDVVKHVAKCWSSLFTDRAIAYRHETGHHHDFLSMSVGVQKMVQPRAAGVAFTLNPSDGDRSQIAIDSSWGFGEAVVGGEVTPDNFLVDKVIFEVVKRTVSPKTIEYRLGEGGVVERADVDEERRLAPSLTDDEIKAVAAMAKRAERHYGTPQDIEWAIDMHLPEGENVILLQSRPETVWSQKKRRSVAAPGAGFMDGIVATLLSPVHSRDKPSTVEE